MKNRGIVVISSLVVIGGGVAFLLWKLNKKKEEQKLKDEEAAKAAAASTNTNTNTGGGGSTGGGGGSTGGGTKPTFTFPFKTKAEGDIFRAYVRAKDKDFAKSIALDATGELNSNVQKAWDKYGADYLKEPAALGLTKGNTLDEVEANLKTNGFPVQRFVTKINTQYYIPPIAATSTSVAKPSSNLAFVFSSNGSFSYARTKNAVSTSGSGKWSNSGNTIILNTGRILKDGIKQNILTLATL